MAELTNLETKLGEVLGLAMAAQGATEKIRGLVKERGDDELVRALERMREEAAETEDRCTKRAEKLDGKKKSVLEKAREVKLEATEMMRTYLGDQADALDGFEFLTMAEAGHWHIVRLMAERAGDSATLDLADWATPIQERHLDQARRGSLDLAAQEDPDGVE